MKRIISVLLICILLLSSFVFVSCDSEEGEGAQTTSTALVLQNSGSSSGSVSEKTPRELLEAFVKDYKNARSFDISVTMVTEEGGESLTEQVDVKISDEVMYMNLAMEEMKMTVWSVGDVTYVDMDGEKYKTSSAGVDDIFGEGFIDTFLSEIPSEFPEEYMKKVDEAKLKVLGGEYYFSVSITDEEAIQMELGDEGYTETMYFDRTGRVTRIVDEAEGYKVTARLNSYGEKITVLAPENSDSFEDMDTAGGGDGGENSGTTSSAEYKQYLAVCNAVQNATKYQMSVTVNGEPYLDYETDGSGELVSVYDGDDNYVMWNVGGTGYIMKNYEYPRATTITNDMREAFTKAKNLKKTMMGGFDEAEMENLSVVQYPDGISMIRFDCTYTTGTMDTYRIEVEQSGNKIVGVFVQIDSMVNYSFTDIVSYYFGIVSDSSFRIDAPI